MLGYITSGFCAQLGYMTVVFCGCAAVYAVCARISARERQEARAERAPQLRQQRLQLQQRLDQQRWLEQHQWLQQVPRQPPPLGGAGGASQLVAAEARCIAVPTITLDAELIASQLATSGQSECSCILCLETLKEGEKVAKLACGHIFHHRGSSCEAGGIETWLDKMASCPTCREPYTPPPPEPATLGAKPDMESVAVMVGMGFEEEIARQCLSVAFNDVDLATQFALERQRAGGSEPGRQSPPPPEPARP